MVEIRKYNVEYKAEWDQFIGNSKNGTFFFLRDFMEYHAERFEDFSLVAVNAKNQIIAIFPANRVNNILYSHGGLTFGGFITNNKMTTEIMLELFKVLKEFCKMHGIENVVYKCIPKIYHTYPADEDLYALFMHNAELIRRDVSTAIFIPRKYQYQERRMRAVKKAIKNHIEVVESDDYGGFWAVLTQILQEQHKVKPVHSLDEMVKLAKKFKDNIKLYVAMLDERILAGTVVFENVKTVHTQYLANSEEGRLVGALDLVIYNLLTTVYKDKEYFDFGISNEQQGRHLNTGLISQKEGFGARAIVHDFYRIIVG